MWSVFVGHPMRTTQLGLHALLLALMVLYVSACSYEDQAVLDTVAPKILSTLPANGALSVSTNAGIEVTFSEKMNPGAGRLVLTPGGTLEVNAGRWDSTAQRFGLRPVSPWPSQTTVSLRIEGFLDLAGNAAPALEITFETADDGDAIPPFAVSSIPIEAQSGVDPALATISITFNEPMAQTTGTLTLEGDSGTLGSSSWTNPFTITAPVSGLLPASIYAVALSGFEDRSGNALDGGPYLGNAKLDFTTGAVGDVTPPRVLSSTPVEGDTSVSAPLGAVVVRFSEAMRTDTSSSALYAGTSTIGTLLSVTWSSGNTVATLDVGGLIAADTTYRVSFAGYRDPAGNLLDPVPYLVNGSLDFATGGAPDVVAPEAVGSDPAEGAIDVALGLTELSISFSESMNPLVATATLTGGSGGPVVLSGVFSAANTIVTLDVTGLLEFNRSYALDLTRLEDAAGNRLNGTPYLVDGSLDFDSEDVPDTTPPTVVNTNPAEGATIAAPTNSVLITFSEAMRTNIGTATLVGPNGSTALPNVWSGGGTILTLNTTALTEYGLSYQVTLTGFADLAGNSLNTVPYLADGELDFAVGPEPDTTPPAVVSTNPVEGVQNVDPALAQVVVTFNEAMDPTVSSAPLTGGALSTSVTASWSVGNTVATFNLSAVTLAFDTAYALDLTSFRDASSNVLNPTPVLGNGRLDFRTLRVPTGEDCGDVLTTAFATSQVGARYTFQVAAAAVTTTDGSFGCDPDGIGRDLVIQYDKVAPNTAAGATGRLLSVRAISDNVNVPLNVEILRGDCDAVNPAAVQEKCVYGRPDWRAYVDGAPGRYWIWISAATSGAAFPGATIEVEEVTAATATGEGCWLPYAAGSTVHTPPANAELPHRFEIPANAIRAFDISETWGEPDSISCVNDATLGDIHGADAVIAFNKQNAASTLQVQATALDGTTPIHIEASSACDPGTGGRVSHACAANAATQNLAFTTGTTGNVYFWVATNRQVTAWPGIRVEIREQTVDAGETCATAQVISAPGVTNLSKISNDRFDAPSCFTTPGPIDWYRYTVTAANVRIFANLAGELGVINAANSAELGCFPNGASLGFGQNITPGTTVCLAVPRNATTTQLTIQDPGDVYAGVGNTVTPIVLGATPAWGAERWLTSSPTRLYLGLADRVFQVGKTSSIAIERNAADGVTAAVLGYAGLARANESLFALDDRTAINESRLTRLTDGATFANTVYDLTPTYVGEDTRALAYDGTNFIFATHANGTTTFYRVSGATPATPVLLGSNQNIELVSGMAADATYLYLAGLGGLGEGIYRLTRADLGTDTTVPSPLAVGVDLDLAGSVAVHLDLAANANYLYFRTRSPSAVRAVARPSTPAPIHLGVISTLGEIGDDGMVYDRTDNSIYLFETETDPAGRLVRIQ